MQSVSKSLPPDIKSAMSGVYDIMHYFDSMPASYSRAFLAVAKDEGQHVDHYARVCGCSNGAMSKRLNDLGQLNSRDRSLPGYGLLDAAPESNGSALHDRQAVIDGRMLAERIAGMMGGA